MTRALCLVLVLLASASVSAQTCTTDWIAASGVWSDDANWSSGAPEAADTACITRSGTYTVTLDRTQTLERLDLGGASGTQTLVMAGTLTTLGSGRIRARGVLENVSSAACASCDGLPAVTGVLRVEGVLSHRDGVGLLSAGGTVDVAPGGLLRVRTGFATVSLGQSGTSTLRVRGRLLFDPDGQTPRAATVVGALDADGGTIEAVSGLVDIQSEGRFRNASLAAGASGHLRFQGPGGSPGIYTVEGSLSGSPQGQVNFLNGELLAAAGGATLAVVGSGLSFLPGTGQTFALASSGGAFTNTGLLHVSSNGLSLRNVSLRNEGTLSVSRTLRLQDAARLEIASGGALDLLNAARVTGGPAGGTILNAGRLVARLDGASSGNASLSVPLDIDGGIIEVSSTRLTLDSQGMLRNSTFNVAQGSEVWIQAGQGSSGVYTGLGTIRGDVQGGLFFFSSSTLQAGAGDFAFEVDGNGIEYRSQTGPRGAFLSAGGAFINRRTLTFTNGFPELLNVTLRNESLLRLATPLNLGDGAVVRNPAGSVVELVNQGGFRQAGDTGGLFVNDGLVLKTGPGTGSFGNLLRGQPGSEIRLLGGNLFFRDEASSNYGAGVRLTGGGEGQRVTLGGPPMEGTISPGTAEEPFQDLTFFLNFRLSDASGDARLVIDIGPDGESDVIRVDGQFTLGGTLVVRVQPGYTPAFGDAWTILSDRTNTTALGRFSAIEVQGAPDGVTFVVDASNSGSVVLRAVAAVSVRAPLATVAEGQPTSFVLSHPASGEPFSIVFETEGTATRFADYTLGASGGLVRAEAGATQTVVTLYPRRDADAGEGPETVLLRLLPGNDAAPAPGADAATVTIQDGPSTDVLALDAVVPARGARLGTVSPTILGVGFGDGATARLVRGGTTIEARLVEAASGEQGVSALFDLEGAPLGAYDVVVEEGGQSATLPGAFEVIEGDPRIRVWADIAGTSSPRIGRWSTYTVFMGNDGDADVHDVGLVLKITAGLEFEFLEGIRDLSDTPAAEQELVLEGTDEVQVVPLWFKSLPARSSGSFRVRVRPTPPLGLGDGMGVGFELYPPDASNPFTWSGDFDDAVPFNYGLVWGGLGAWSIAFPPGDGADAPEASGAAAKRDSGPNTDWNRDDDIANYTDDQIFDEYDTAGRFNQYYGTDHQPSASTAASAYAGFALEQPLANATRSLGYGSAGLAVSGVSSMWTIRSYGLKSRQILCDRGILPATDPSCGPRPPNGPPGGGGGGANGGWGTGGAGGKGGGSHDPNAKYGPTGTGGQRYYDPAVVTTPYTIAFENVATATFPAQEVIIVDTLDTDVFDLSTFALGPIRWGNGNSVTPPPGAQTFETEVDLAPEVAATLLITASLDALTGRAVWHFVTLDPATGDLPEDGTVGFLAPNATQPEGEGWVTFNVETKQGLPSGTRVENEAEIVFDVNAPIQTPLWSNTIDTAPPATSVQPLAGTETNPIAITATGADAESGILVYDLFASRDGGPFEFVAQSHDGVFEFTGEAGSTYGFYSLGVDFVTNIEGPKTEAEATTRVAVAGEEVPDRPLALTLEAPRPNPARGLVRLRFGMPSAGEASVRILDALGREVATLASGETSAGWHTAEWSPGVASGVYVVEIRSGDEVRHQRLTVVR